MTTNFWSTIKQKHPEGAMVLAPMADVTDNPFRRILSEIGAPDVYWNEFVSADGLSHPVARPKLERMLAFEEEQRPIVAQIFSGTPDHCRQAAELCAQKGFDAIDINMGCPQKNILKQTCGAELCKVEHRELVREIVEQSRIGAGDLPLSIKTRIGFNQIDLTWIEFLLEMQLPVLTIHLRTKKEMSKVPAHWELMTQIREMRDKIAPDTLIFGNGDVESVQQGKELCGQHGIDGVMFGRALFADPWLFAKHIKDRTVAERLELALLHTRYYLEEYTVDGELTKNFNLMKKFYKVYINGFPGAKELRIQMMEAKNYADIEKICANY